MRGQGRSRMRRFAPLSACAALCLLLAQCSNSHVDPRYGVSASPRVVEAGEPVPKGGGTYRVGTPYVVAGRTYVPEDNRHYRAEGLASWYGEDFHGRLTANGEVYDVAAISAAHPTLPLPSYVRVTNLLNHRSLIVRVNDRGPYHSERLIDVSGRAAQLLEFRRRGTTFVRIEYLGPAPMQGSDDRVLEATLRQDRPAPAPNFARSAARSDGIPQGRALPPAPPPPRIAANASPEIVPEVTGSRAASYAGAAPARDGIDQLLNGRGLY